MPQRLSGEDGTGIAFAANTGEHLSGTDADADDAAYYRRAIAEWRNDGCGPWQWDEGCDVHRQPDRARQARGLTLGRPRKQPPVSVPADMKYCWACRSTLPLASFAIDRQQHDGKKMDCRVCDSAAATARIKARSERLKLQLAA